MDFSGMMRWMMFVNILTLRVTLVLKSLTISFSSSFLKNASKSSKSISTVLLSPLATFCWDKIRAYDFDQILFTAVPLISRRHIPELVVLESTNELFALGYLFFIAESLWWLELHPLILVINNILAGKINNILALARIAIKRKQITKLLMFARSISLGNWA